MLREYLQPTAGASCTFGNQPRVQLVRALRYIAGAQEPVDQWSLQKDEISALTGFHCAPNCYLVYH